MDNCPYYHPQQRISINCTAIWLCILLCSCAVMLCFQANPVYCQSWELKHYNANQVLTEVHWYGDSLAFVVGENGLILKSTNQGMTWQKLDNAYPIRFDDVYILSPSVILIVGDYQIIRTVNGGKTWYDPSVSDTLFDYSKLGFRYSIDFIENTLIGLSSGNYIDNSSIYVPSIMRTTDGGITWKLCSYGSDLLALRLTIIDKEIAMVVHANTINQISYIYKTTDLGESWQQTSILPIIVTDMDFSDRSIGWACGNGTNVFRTTNAGKIWEIKQTGMFNNGYLGVVAFDELHAMFCGDNGDIVRTTDGGETWQLESTLLTNGFYAIAFNKAGIGLAVGEEGAIARFDPKTSNVPNEQRSATNGVKQFTVGLQTPDMSMLQFEIAKPMELSLMLYNSRGEIVKSQPPQSYHHGVHTVRLETAGLPSGAYFCVGRWRSEQYFESSNCMLIVNN